MEQDQVLRALESPGAYPHDVGSIDVIETHISWVFLTGELAYKVKKAIELPFVDFSTLERREQFCHDELSLNRRLAPDLYLDVVPIGIERGEVRVGAEPAIEYAVKMKQFPADATADHLLATDATDAPDEDRFSEFGRRLAQFHDALPPSTTRDPTAGVLSNLEEFEALEWTIDRPILESVAARLRDDSTRYESLFSSRSRDGFVRECHGDLHLGNLALIDGSLTAFDCLEFDAELRTIDVIDEAAFLVMDLEAHGRTDLAFAFLNGYLEATGDFDGLRLLRYYAAHRALVRAKVAALSAGRSQTSADPEPVSRYLGTAAALCRRERARLLITFGLSGSGKTTVARSLSGRLGAIHMRSDVERKRLHGLSAGARSHSAIGRGLYDSDASAATYARLAEAAEGALAGGLNTIVDASFLTRANRDRFRELASSCDADFVILACSASEEQLRERISKREQAGQDASEAGQSVLDYQLRTMDSLGDDELPLTLEVDTEARPDPDRIARALDDGPLVNR